jgi:hypothetical protein
LHAWVDPLLEQLQKGKEARVIRRLEDLQQTETLAAGETVVADRETRYFQEHRNHIHYQRWKRAALRAAAEPSNRWDCSSSVDFAPAGNFGNARV